MSLITWSDEYSVNIKEIDKQHRQLVEIINQLHRAMRDGSSRQIMKDTLTRLIDYTDSHFTTEEDLMSAYNYPGYVAHKAEHTQLKKRVLDYQRQFDQNPLGMGVQTMEFLKSWLMDHVIGMDKKYTRYLNSQGIN